MTWSLGEIRSLATKAARGAGLPWGLAEEAGYSVQWLEQHGAPGAKILVAYCKWCESQDGGESKYCPIARGAAISDAQSLEGMLDQAVIFPYLMLPFVADHASQDWHVMNLGEKSVAFCGNGIAINSPMDIEYSSPLMISVKPCTEQHALVDPVDRVCDRESKSVEMLLKFAHKTYAPSTEHSRTAGAGAGTDDND